MPVRRELQDALSRVLSAIGEHADAIRGDLTPFMPVCGPAFDGKLMVVGRAVNQWWHKYQASEFTDPIKRADIIMAEDGLTFPPSDYLRRSPFWQTTRALLADVDELAAQSENWTHLIVWSNLYKVSYFDGGNPLSKLQEAQRAACGAMLKTELTLFAPEFVVFWTGFDWAEPFLADIGASGKRSNRGASGLIQYVGRVACSERAPAARIVVAKHPQGKPGSAEEKAKAVFAALQSA